MFFDFFAEIWGSNPGRPGRLQTHQTTNRDPESIHISRNNQKYVRNISDIQYFRNMSDIFQKYFRPRTKPILGRQKKDRKQFRNYIVLDSFTLGWWDFTILVFDTQFHKLTQVNRFAYKLCIFSVQCIDIEAMAKVQTICVKNVAITDTCPTIQRPRWAKCSTSTPLRSLRQLGQTCSVRSHFRKHSMPETKTLRPRGKPVSSKETRHSDITPSILVTVIAWQRYLWSSLTDPRLQRDALDPPW